MHTKTVGRIEKTVGDERSNFLIHKEALSMDPSLHWWPKTKKQGPDTKDIPEDRDIGTVRVKCSSLFQRWCVAGLGQLCHCHLMLLVGKVMGVALMCRWGLWAAARPAVSPWFAPHGTQDKEGSQPVRGHIAKGRDTAQWGGVSQAQAFGGGLWLSLLCVQVFHGYMLEKIGYLWVATWFGLMTMPFKT